MPDAVIGVEAAERDGWSICEHFVWSCLRQGLEANLYDKTCYVPRQEPSRAARATYRFAPFVSPDDYKDSNGLTDKFLISALTDPHYTRQIPPIGVRIVGAYFANGVNLENVTTTINLVLDQSIFRQGLRLTNFKSEKNLAIDGSNVRGTVHMMRARIDGSVFMERAVLDHIDFNDARIGSSVEATGALFNGEFRLMRAAIDGKVNFTKARLTSLIGWSAHFGSSLEMRLADVRIGIDLTGTSVDGDVRLPDVSFGRRQITPKPYCDWDPTIEADHILNMLHAALPPEAFAKTWKEVIEVRDVKNGVPALNVCQDDSQITQRAARDNVLLRDMKIKGALCIVDVDGEIKSMPGVVNTSPSAIKIISLEGSDAKSTILRWKNSPSPTEWRAVNYKTEYMLIDLNSQPQKHYVDNLDLRQIMLIKKNLDGVRAPSTASVSDEHLVKLKCDINPDEHNISASDDEKRSRDAQDRLIRFFHQDKSESAQPFSVVVASLHSSGVNTVHLRKALSQLQFRNACTNSELAKAYRQMPWAGLRKALTDIYDRKPSDLNDWDFAIRELKNVGLDAGCNIWLFMHQHAASYGHEPLRIAGWILVTVALFWLVLKFDSPGPELLGGRHRFGVIYAIDNLIPLRQYRIDPEKADIAPNRRMLRVWRYMHRVLGLVLAVMVFVYVYKSATY